MGRMLEYSCGCSIFSASSPMQHHEHGQIMVICTTHRCAHRELKTLEGNSGAVMCLLHSYISGCSLPIWKYVGPCLQKKTKQCWGSVMFYSINERAFADFYMNSVFLGTL